MADHLADKEWVAAFEKPKGNPALFTKPATTCLSPYLKFGCMSSRLFYCQLAGVSQICCNLNSKPLNINLHKLVCLQPLGLPYSPGEELAPLLLQDILIW